MSITYDPETRRATHTESGMAVEYIGDGPYVQERDTYFKVILNGVAYKFRADWDSGYLKICQMFPELEPWEQSAKMDELNERNFTTSLSGVKNRNLLALETDDPVQIFLKLWHRVVSERYPTKRCSVYYKSNFAPSNGEWKVEG